MAAFPTMTRSRALALGSLFLLVVCTGWARSSLLRAGLPHAPQNDEHVYVWHQALFRGPDDPRADPFYGFYPQLVSRLASLVPRPAAAEPLSLEQHLAAASADYVRARIVVLLLSLVALPATWILARRWLAPPAAWLAAALVATSTLTTWHAAESRPHAAFAALAVASVAAASEVERRGGWPRHLVAGALAGLALATLQPGLLCFGPLVAAHLLRAKAERRRERLALVLALLLGLCVALPFYPSLFVHVRPLADPRPAGARDFFGHDLYPGLFDGSGFVRLAAALLNAETLAAGLALASLVAWIVRPRRARRLPSPPALVAAAFALPYALVFGLYHLTYPRFVLPLLPFVAIAAAASLDRFRASRTRLAAAIVVFALAVLPCRALVRVRAAPDTTERAARWIEAHVPRTDTLHVLRSLELPLARDPATAGAPQPTIGLRISAWRNYVREHPGELRRLQTWRLVDVRLPWKAGGRLDDPGAFVAALGAHWLVLEVRPRPFLSELVDWARAHALETARFAPGFASDGDERDFTVFGDMQGNRVPWLRDVLQVRSVGAPIEIYRLP